MAGLAAGSGMAMSFHRYHMFFALVAVTGLAGAHVLVYRKKHPQIAEIVVLWVATLLTLLSIISGLKSHHLE